MRALNQRLVLDRLRGHGEATRPQIAIDTGLSKPTVGQALLDLEQQGLVRAIGRSAAGPGRSAVIYRTAPDAGHIVGVDIGRRVIRVAVADLDGGVVARVDRPNRSRSGTMLQRNACDAVESTIAEAGLSPHDIVVTVVGTPGIPDAATGTVHRAPNLPGWERRGLLHELVAALGAGGSEVMVENDANLSVVGEHARGAAQGVDVVACLTVGTGIGMGVLLNGKLFRGAHGAAGEIADLPFDRVPPGVTQHRPGPVETAAAAQAVVAAANELGLSRVNSAKAVFDLAREHIGALIVLLKEGRVDAVVALIIIGREIAISALREWMAKVGQAKSVAVAFIGKLKTLSQMIAIPLLLLYDDNLLGVVDCSVLGTILINVAAVLTVVSMLYYLRKALPYASVRG